MFTKVRHQIHEREDRTIVACGSSANGSPVSITLWIQKKDVVVKEGKRRINWSRSITVLLDIWMKLVVIVGVTILTIQQTRVSLIMSRFSRIRWAYLILRWI